MTNQDGVVDGWQSEQLLEVPTEAVNAVEVGIKLGGTVITLVVGYDLIAMAGKVFNLTRSNLLVATKAVDEDQALAVTNDLVVKAESIISP